MTDQPRYSELGFSDAEWGLLVGLPQAVLTAASAATPDGARKTRAEHAAGLAQLADARLSANALVVAVANAAVALTGDPEQGEQAPLIEPSDPIGYAQDVLDRATQARTLLADKAAEADAASYRLWLVDIADAVVGAASTGGVLGIGGETVTESERAFRDDLARVLSE